MTRYCLRRCTRYGNNRSRQATVEEARYRCNMLKRPGIIITRSVIFNHRTQYLLIRPDFDIHKIRCPLITVPGIYSTGPVLRFYKIRHMLNDPVQYKNYPAQLIIRTGICWTNILYMMPFEKAGCSIITGSGTVNHKNRYPLKRPGTDIIPVEKPRYSNRRIGYLYYENRYLMKLPGTDIISVKKPRYSYSKKNRYLLKGPDIDIFSISNLPWLYPYFTRYHNILVPVIIKSIIYTVATRPCTGTGR